MNTEIKIPVAQLKQMIDQLPLHLNRDENERRRFIIRESVTVHINDSSPMPFRPHYQKEVEFVFNFETADWELRGVIFK